jgi:hypothetical protein
VLLYKLVKLVIPLTVGENKLPYIHMPEKLGPCQKDEANVELGELDRARNSIHRDFDSIKLCISWINGVRTWVDKFGDTFRHIDWKAPNLGGCGWSRAQINDVSRRLVKRMMMFVRRQMRCLRSGPPGFSAVKTLACMPRLWLSRGLTHGDLAYVHVDRWMTNESETEGQKFEKETNAVLRDCSSGSVILPGSCDSKRNNRRTIDNLDEGLTKIGTNLAKQR